MGEDGESSRARDDEAPDREPTQEPEAPAAPVASRPRPPVDRAIARLGGSLGGRSLSVYGVLLAGAAVLLILLAIVWITANDSGDNEGPTCLNLPLEEALPLVPAGEIERVRISYREGAATLGPAALRLDTVDGSCHNLQPQGAEGQFAINQLLGVIAFYNATTEDRRISVDYDPRDDIQADFLWTPTPTPTESPVPTATTEPASPTAVPPTETPAPTPTPAIGSPDASPDASPIAGSPVAPTGETPPAG